MYRCKYEIYVRQVYPVYVHRQCMCTDSVCVQTVYVYIQCMCTDSVCVQTVSVYIQCMCTDSVCVQTVSVYRQCMCTDSVCVPAGSFACCLQCVSRPSGTAHWWRFPLPWQIALEPQHWSSERKGGKKCLSTLGAHWEHIGSTLGAHWEHMGSTWGAHWEHIGSTLGAHWEYIEGVQWDFGVREGGVMTVQKTVSYTRNILTVYNFD